MRRLETALRARRSQGRKLLVPYLTGGYPDRETNRGLLLAAQEAGADAVELGIPFSDPSADGPVIQRASEASLKGGTRVASLLEDVARARRAGLQMPLLLMTYFNPILAFGVERFAREASAAGVDGVLVVDLPLEETEEFVPAATAAGLEPVSLVAPTTPEERVARIVARAQGFVYCVSVTGVTGEKQPLQEVVGELVARVRRHTDLPALAGFGVSDPESARTIARVADGVIVGSALLQRLEGLKGEAAVTAGRDFLVSLRRALDESEASG